MLSDRDTADTIVPILKNVLMRFGFDRAEVASGLNHADMPAVFVTVHYGKTAPKPDGRVLLDAPVAANAAMASAGDERFAYVQHRYQDGEPAIEEFGRPARRRAKAAK